MAGSVGESEDNPVPLNVTAMVDIIFCLCIFFMCSFHFKQLEGKIDSWLPKDKGVHGTPIDNVVLEEIRVIMKYDTSGQQTITKLGHQPVSSWEQLGQYILASYKDYEDLGKGKDVVPVIIDAEPLVPWREVIEVMNVCKALNLEKIEFAAPLPTP